MKLPITLAALAASQLIASHASPPLNTDQASLYRRCRDKLKSRQVYDALAMRKRELAGALRRRSGSNTDKGSLYDQDDTPPSCLLAPQEPLGPDYIPGQPIREDITDDQQGIMLAFGIQFLDVETCEPVTNAYVDVWHANATGSYSSSLRGLQPTDSYGIAQFITIFPGHHPNRTPHIHLLVHHHHHHHHPQTPSSPSPSPSLTLASHIAQIYFNQNMIHRILRRSPYTNNKHPLTLNNDDHFLSDNLKAGGYPFMDVMELDVDVDSGLLGWISFGINTTYSKTIEPAGLAYQPGDGLAADTWSELR